MGVIFTQQTYKKTFRDAFDFLQRWQPCPASLEEWEAAARESGIIAEQGGNDKLLIDLLIAIFDEMNRRYQEQQKEGNVQRCG